ncbi:MAG: hypothetical protein ACLUPF_00460 [Dorea sp.]
MSYQLLIVDDEVLIRKALSQYIDWESLNCVGARNCQQWKRSN